MQVIKEQDWTSLPEQAQQEAYDFFIFIKHRYDKQAEQKRYDETETLAFSNHSAKTVEQWLDDKEDEIWKQMPRMLCGVNFILVI